MRATESWSYPHYLPLHEKARAKAPYICRIAPRADGSVPEAYYRAVKEFGEAIKAE